MVEKSRLRIAVVISHPIQHFCPQYVNFAKNSDIQLKVFFASTLGLKKYLDNNFKEEISWSNLHLDKFDHVFLNGDQLLLPNNNLDAPSLARELKDFQPDLLFTYGYFQKLQRRAKRWAIKNKIKTAYISDGELLHKRRFGKELLKDIYLTHYFSKINYFLTLGNANKEYYKKYQVNEEKFLRMHHPIDFCRYQKSYLQKETLRNDLRERYHIDEKEITLCVVGKLVKWKNQDHIIDAMKILEKEGINLTLFILGSGEMKEYLQVKSMDLKKSKVFFPGFVNIEELPSYYAASDIYVHPASLEPHSVAVSEAIMMGCPVILSDRCGSYGDEDDVQEEKNGYVFKFGNIEDLAAKIKWLATNNERRKAFADHSHNIAVSFQQKSHFGMIENLLKRVG
jgi:glycosyltransferase involved in cell wall biosynthesis